MNLVFSLPRSQKEAALISKRLIADLSKEAACLPIHLRQRSQNDAKTESI